MGDTQGTLDPDDTSASPPPAERAVAVPPVVTYEISTRSIWQVIGAILLTLIGIVLVLRARDLVGMLIISVFFSLALVPLVERLHRRFGWKRGAAVGVIYVAGAVFFIVMVVFLIPMIVEVAQRIGNNWSTWMDNINNWAERNFSVSLSDIGPATDAGEEAAGAAEDWS
jgi:predicted PurR-regulated permease PerM